MVEERSQLEPDVKQIFTAIDQERNFLLSGGAGSGKTYSLVQVIRQVLLEHPNANVACMTYTNAAVKEIEERVDHNNLNVSTIHDFLWDNIKLYQKELKKALVDLINDENIKKITMDSAGSIAHNYFDTFEDGVQYKEFVRIREGIISHNELLIIAHHLFEKYPRLSAIVKDRYPFIFIDEYQDTDGAVVEIFLTHFKSSSKKNIIGFFGDAMQSIYDDGIGNLDSYRDSEMLVEIKKEQNRRSPEKIIALANWLRTDGIIQRPSQDPNAPNMVDGIIKEGNLFFLYSKSNDLELARQFLRNSYDWDFKNPIDTKELNLTHNLIADKAEFRTLMDIYDKDLIIDFRDRIKDYIKDQNITTDFSSNTFGEVINILQKGKTGRELNAVSPTNGMQTFIDQNQGLYAIALDQNFASFSNLYINKDQLLDDKKQSVLEESKKGSKRDHLIKHLYKIQLTISLYSEKRYNEFLRITDYRHHIKKIQDKRNLEIHINNLVDVGEKTIEQVITQAHENGICLIGDGLIKFMKEKEYLFNRVKGVKFKEFQKLFEYLEGYTPFSTQHKTKGAEFNNVFVSLDTGGWNKYNFQALFTGSGTASVIERTAKLFYVCCTRSKENLAVFFHDPSPQVVEKAKLWFGVDNVKNLDELI